MPSIAQDGQRVMVVWLDMDAPPATPPPKAAAYWPPTMAMMAVHVAFAWGLMTIPILGPVLVPVVGYGPEILGFYGAVIWTAGFLATFLTGPAINRFGAVRVSQFCTCCFGAGLLMGEFGALWAFAIGSVFLGFGAATESPASSALLIRVAPPARRGFIFSVKQIGVPIGGFIAGFAIPALLPLLGWRGVLALVAALCFALVLALEPIRRRYDPPPALRPPPMQGNALQDMVAGWRFCWAIPAMRPLLIANAPYNALQFSMHTFLVVRLVTELHLSLVMAGAMIAVMQICGLAGRLGLGWLADRFTSPRGILIAVGFCMLATGTAVAIYSPAWPTWPLFIVVAIFGLTGNAWNGVFMAEVARLVPPAEAGRASAVAMMASIFGVIAAPLAVGWIVAVSGFGAAFGAVTATVLIAVVALLRR